MLALSFQTAQAGMIGAEQAAAPTTSAERMVVLSALGRAEVASQLQAAVIDPNDARALVATMSDQEVQTLARDIQSAPAGADISTGGWVAILLAIGLIWYFAYRK